jgi:hypothetical protein
MRAAQLAKHALTRLRKLLDRNDCVDESELSGFGGISRTASEKHEVELLRRKAYQKCRPNDGSVSP